MNVDAHALSPFPLQSGLETASRSIVSNFRIPGFCDEELRLGMRLFYGFAFRSKIRLPSNRKRA
jgi:hypothetical protein